MRVMTYRVIETREIKGVWKRKVLRRGLEEDFAKRVRNAREWENQRHGKENRSVTVEKDR